MQRVRRHGERRYKPCGCCYLSAADFVPWYNAHPDYTEVDVSLDAETAIVIGAGNVAMDVARMLALDPSELDPTDTAEHAIAALKNSNIRKVYICARRGAEHAATIAASMSLLLMMTFVCSSFGSSRNSGDVNAACSAPRRAQI